MATKEQQMKANGVTPEQVASIEALYKTPTTPAATPGTGAGTPSSTPTAGGDSFLSALQSKLLAQSEMVSSQDTNIEKSIQTAISTLNGGKDSANASINSTFDRAVGYAKGDQQTAITGEMEGQRGYAVNVSALREITKTTDKNINDLESRRSEALLANDAATAGKIAELQMKELEFKQESQQRVFSNLLNLGQFTLQGDQLAENKRQFNVNQSFQEKSELSKIALTYGIELKDGDTIDTVVARAAPFASARQKLELEQIRSSIRENNAQTAKALKGDSVSMTPELIASLAQAGASNPAVLGLIKDPALGAAVVNQITELNKPRDYTAAELTPIIQSFRNTGASATTIKAEIAKDAKITNKEGAFALVDQTFGIKPQAVKTTAQTLNDLSSSLGINGINK